MSGPDDRENARLQAKRALRDDLKLYARHCLQIRPKSGTPIPLIFNRAQIELHHALEEQKAKTGRVRALVLKGRQMGISTYIGARFYHATTHRKGCRTFILTHLDDATDNLFGMVRRFHDYCPPELRPQTGTASAKELAFSLLDSGYKVGTAGSKAIGRSDTIQLFHGSEMAFWPSAETHAAGIVQAVAQADGTEDIRESTANGIGGAFHSMWKAAERGDSEFQCVFLPWFIHEEYARPAPDDWSPPEAFHEYEQIYNLARNQTYWAWLKNREAAAVVGGDPGEINWQFKQEYPANSDEAFQTSGANHFIKPESVLRARKRQITGIGPLVLGVDPARGGSDRMGIIDRQGRRAGAYVMERYLTSKDQRANAGHVVQVVKRLRENGAPLRKVCIDCTDGGAVFEFCREQLGDELVEGIMFGESAHDRDHYANRRAEMWDLLRQWLDDPIGVQLPDKDDLQGDLCSTSWGSGLTHHRPNGQLVLEPKEKIKQRLNASPDLGDALALTFAVDYSELIEPQSQSTGTHPLGAHAWLA